MMLHRYGAFAAGFIAVASLTGFTYTAQAQDPTAVIDTRRAELKKASAAAKVVGGFVKEDKGTVADVQAAAATIEAVSKAFPNWWPAGTADGVGKSEAKPDIWTRPDEFKTLTASFQTEAAALVKVAAAGDKAAIAAQFGKTVGTCGTCHKTFREE